MGSFIQFGSVGIFSSCIETRLAHQPEKNAIEESCNLQFCWKSHGPRFVSHWWGEPVVQFIACVAKQLAETVPYWVCAYANNQPLVPQQKLQGKP